jgi:transcriptional regulator with XRE-family HTH domain
MEPETSNLQLKVLGVLIRMAREKSRRTIPDVATRIGVTPARIRQYERGDREITMPELERLALFLQVPLSFFLSGRVGSQENKVQPPTEAEIRAHRAMIGAKLKQARLSAGMAKEQLAQAMSVRAATIVRYERGLKDIPITELERLAQVLHVTLMYFIEDRSANKETAALLDLEKLSQMPPDLREFVLDPSNTPFLRMALKFRELPRNKLKELGEVMLVVR